MTVIAVDHWLATAERVRFRTRRVSGGRVSVCLGRLPRGSYQVAVDTGAPGCHGWSACLADELTFANRHNAVLGGLVAIREYWRSQDVPAMVADLDDIIREVWT